MDDAPTPGFINIINFEEKIIKSSDFSLKYENYKYQLKMKLGKEYLYLEISEDDNILFFYQIKFSLSNLFEFDKIFKTCDKLDEAYELMGEYINNEKTCIKNISEKKIIILINILQANGKTIEKEITLFKQYNRTENVIEILSKEIKELKLKQNNMEKEISELKEENKKLKEKNQHQDLNEIKEIKDKINYFFDKSIIKSTIIPDTKKFEFIKERLSKVDINGKQGHKLFFELLYRAKWHGDKAKDFHSRCDIYRNTLSIIKTKDGLVFGGFTTKTWEGNDFDKADENAFCFSLDKIKIYNSIKGKSAIFTSPNSGPCFQNCIFEVKDKCFENGGTCDLNVNSYFDNIETEYEINGGNDIFIVEDLEVFAVYFE